jgi:hypothetical protein
LTSNDIHAVEWETDLTPRARLLLPGNQQMEFTAALARRTVTIWANDRSIHVLLDGTVIRIRLHGCPSTTFASFCAAVHVWPEPNLPAVRSP